MDMKWFDIIIAVCLLAYGYKFLKNPPEFGSSQGIGTKRSKKSKEAWAYGHRVAGIYCLVSGIVVAALTVVQYYVLGDSVPKAFIYVSYGLELLIIAFAIPTINWSIKAKFGDQ